MLPVVEPLLVIFAPVTVTAGVPLTVEFPPVITVPDGEVPGVKVEGSTPAVAGVDTVMFPPLVVGGTL